MCFSLIAAIAICSDFGAQENKICHRFHCFPIYLPWSDGARCHDLHFFECWVLSQLFYSPLSPSSKGSLIPLCFLPLGWCHLHIWGYWYFFQQSCLLVFQKQIPVSFKNLNGRYDFPMCHSKQALILEYIISSYTIKIFLFPLLPSTSKFLIINNLKS